MSDKNEKFEEHAALISEASSTLFKILDTIASMGNYTVETVMEIAHSFMAQVVYYSITRLKKDDAKNVAWALGIHRKMYDKMEEGVKLLLAQDKAEKLDKTELN